MASIKFMLQSKSDNAQIYIRISISKNHSVKKKTGFVINFKDWSEATSMPKQNLAENKHLYNNLKKLETFIFSQLNNDTANGAIIDGYWLEDKINQCFGRIEKTDHDLLVNHIQYIIDTADTRETKNGKIGYSPNTIKNYGIFKKIILKYQEVIKKQIRFTEIDKAFTDKFKHWLINDKGYAVNYAGRQFEFLKSVSKDAENHNVNVSRHATAIKSFKESEEDRHIQTLSFAELEKINKTVMPSELLENVKKWLLIGCFTGQRKSDLFNITQDRFREAEKGLRIDILVQRKTDKHVPIAIPYRFAYIVDIIQNHFPTKISEQRFNKYVKEVCRVAKIEDIVTGHVYGERRQTGDYPKWQLIASHCCRRSFATNFYELGVSAQILMQITGHSTEQMFLKYINKRLDKDVFADSFFETVERRFAEKEIQPKEPQQEKEHKLRIV